MSYIISKRTEGETMYLCSCDTDCGAILFNWVCRKDDAALFTSLAATEAITFLCDGAAEWRE